MCEKSASTLKFCAWQGLAGAAVVDSSIDNTRSLYWTRCNVWLHDPW